MKLWVDDVRNPPDPSWRAHARTADAAIACLKYLVVEEVSLDYDLGPADSAGYFGKGTGLQVAQYIAGMEKPPTTVRVHSANPIGAQEIIQTLLSVPRITIIRTVA